MFVFRQYGYIPARWLYLVKNGCIQAKLALFEQKWLISGKSGCNWENVGIWAIVVVFGQSGCIRAKVLVFGQKRL